MKKLFLFLFVSSIITAQKKVKNGTIYIDHPGIELINEFNEAFVNADTITLDRILDEKVKIKSNLLSTGKILGILENDPKEWLGYSQQNIENSEEIERLINERNEARRNKNFNLADTIRDTLKEKGIEIEDKDKGTVWRKTNEQ